MQTWQLTSRNWLTLCISFIWLSFCLDNMVHDSSSQGLLEKGKHDWGLTSCQTCIWDFIINWQPHHGSSVSSLRHSTTPCATASWGLWSAESNKNVCRILSEIMSHHSRLDPGMDLRYFKRWCRSPVMNTSTEICRSSLFSCWYCKQI